MPLGNVHLCILNPLYHAPRVELHRQCAPPVTVGSANARDALVLGSGFRQQRTLDVGDRKRARRVCIPMLRSP